MIQSFPRNSGGFNFALYFYLWKANRLDPDHCTYSFIETGWLNIEPCVILGVSVFEFALDSHSCWLKSCNDTICDLEKHFK